MNKGDKFKKWQLLENLDGGKGGNGVVWKVSNIENGKQAAIKFLQPRHYSNPKRVSRFKDEIKSMQACQDLSGVLKLLDYHLPEHPSIKDPIWFVSQLAKPLELKLEEDYTTVTAVEACLAYANTLIQMHERGISHRDIKPDNLFYADENWLIGDFGLADFPEKAGVTEQAERIGPLFYMAPEMLLDAINSDGKPADVWSLAKVLWKLITKQRYPLEGTFRRDVPALRISTYSNNQNSYKLDSVLEAATQIDPKHRITMNDFYLELQAWISAERSIGTTKPNVEANVETLKNRLAGMFQAAKKDQVERKIKAEIASAISEIGEDLLIKIQKQVLNDIDSLIVETGLEHDLNTSTPRHNQFMEIFDKFGLPDWSKVLWRGTANSLIYPAVMSEKYLSGFFYGVAIAIGEDKKMYIMEGYWAYHFNRLGKEPRNSYDNYWLHTSSIIINGTKHQEVVKDIELRMKNNFAQSFGLFLDQIKDYNIYRETLNKKT